MIALALWLLSFVAPNVALLGHDEWAIREAETERCDTPLLTLLLPAWHEDAEVNYRCRTLRHRNLKLLRSEWWDRTARRHDYGLWLDYYFCAGRSCVAVEDAYVELCEADWSKLIEFDSRWRIFDRGDGPFGVMLEPWEFVELCHYHWFRAPLPREK